MSSSGSPADRRAFLLGAAALVVSACSSADEPVAGSTTVADSSPSATAGSPTAGSSTAVPSTDVPSSGAQPINETEPLTPAMFDAAATCVLTATSSAGPFPTAAPLDRRVIHEGLPGHPLRLGLRVVDPECAPIPNAVVDVWHTDATGDYSEFQDGGSGKDEGPGSTFCRGQQTGDVDGIVEFETIYPGWYEGRAVHIHVQVAVEGENVFTGQLYFDEATTEFVHQAEPYAEFGPPDTPWSRDGLIGDPTTDGTGLTLREATTGIGPGTLGLVTLGVPA